ncbi:Response regulator receiver domain-containing protein [Xylanibacter ruminicola]|uniref:Response regulator receiver domain-containing protein n=2 Tax=Xylanibacter ruminicola TaxID=839 RepID=A0A1H4C3U7_XYLRU|nr:Response regulator receiver domain-containing protein [Xylanibacter ruminicola]
MKILLVEDDEHKTNDIITYIESMNKMIDVSTARSVESGVQAAVDDQYDLILLDMTIPNFDITEKSDGGKSYKNGGEIIVKELLDEEVEFRCAVITQYETFNNETIDQISARIGKLCGENYLGYVKYSTNTESWRQGLKEYIEYVENLTD